MSEVRRTRGGARRGEKGRGPARRRHVPGRIYTGFAGAGVVLGLGAGIMAGFLGQTVVVAGLLGVGVAFGLCLVGLRVEVGRVGRHVEDLLAAGEYEAAGKYLERARANHVDDSRLRALAARAEAGPPAEAAPPTEEEEEEPASGPIGPVLTGKGVAVVALLVPAFLPGVALLAGPALLVVSILLLRAGEPRVWDRPVAKLGLAVAVLSLLTGGLLVAGLLSPRGTTEDMPDPGYAEMPVDVRIVQFLVLFLSIVLHECAHGAAARISGDDTAHRAGRITLNPIRHVDPVGSVLLPGILLATGAGVVFGWAKPVPVRKELYRRPRGGDLFVSTAGVLTNLLLALLSAALLLSLAFALSRAFPRAEILDFAQPFLKVRISGVPLAGALTLAVELLKAGILVNLFLATLNILPIPPLDGFHALLTLLPAFASRALGRLAPLGFILLIVLLTSDVFSFVAIPAALGGVVVMFLSRVLFGL